MDPQLKERLRSIESKIDEINHKLNKLLVEDDFGEEPKGEDEEHEHKIEWTKEEEAITLDEIGKDEEMKDQPIK